MRILFDQGTPVAIRRFLVGHTVRTTRQEGWETVSNGRLIAAAELAGFDLLITTDNSLGYQQNLDGRRLSILVLSRNRWQSVLRVMPEIVAAVESSHAGSFAIVEVPLR